MRSRLLAVVVVAFVVLSLAGYALPVSAQTKDEYTFVVITHSASISFWVPLVKGAQDAARHISAGDGVTIHIRHMGPALFDVAEQVAIMENAIQSGVDGIIATLPDPNAFRAPIQEAHRRGIPVIATNTDDPGSDRMAFVGMDDVAAGRTLANRVIQLIGTEGKIAIGVEDPGHTSLEARLAGVREVLDRTNIQYTILNTTADLTQAVSVFESYLLANPDAKGIFSVDATGTSAHGTVLRNLGLKGRVVSGGWDLVPATLENIIEGYTDFTLDQNPYAQGYYPVVMLYNYLNYGIEPGDMDSGAGIVDQDTVHSVLELARQGYR